MNIEKLFELAETANDAELMWILNQLTSVARDPERLPDMINFHRLYGKKIVAIYECWNLFQLRSEEMIESVAESMRARLEA